MKSLLLLLVLAGFCRADELSDTIAELKATYQKMEGYEATYQLATQKGQTGTIDLGVDFESGWGYIKTTLKDEKGAIFRQAEQWVTADGLLVMKAGDQLAVFEGAKEMRERTNDLHKALIDKADEIGKPIETIFEPQCYLTQESFDMSFRFGSKGFKLPNEIEKLLSKTDKEIKLDLGPEHGVVNIDPKTSVITSQVIPVGQEKRTMTLTHFKKNPGKEAISSRMDLKIDEAPKRPITEMGFGKTNLRELLQEFLVSVAESKKDVASVQKTLEPALIKFLLEEPLDQAGFIAPEMLNSLIDQTITEAIPLLRADGKNLTPKQLILIPGFQNQMINTFAKMLFPRVPRERKKEYLAEALGGALVSEKPTETEARILIEELVIRSYFQVRLWRTINQYAKKLNEGE